ncbi:MAG: pyridoxamine 5'-phosphate oxidase family protein [Eubacteriales bacterium]|nr:pyridoxamine 5'-phosphate oxidase family protein [Eubacteriales bacterium]
MRRKDREITDVNAINGMIQACDCCRLGIKDGNSVYIVPLNFGYSYIGGKGVFYFHCANEGKKLTLLGHGSAVGFELDTNHQLVRGEKGCDFTFLYSSVIGRGIVTRIEETEEKERALALIVSHYGGPGDWHFTEAEAQSVTVLRLDVLKMTAKENRR